MLPTRLRPHLFLSYSRIDRKAADALSDAMRSQGCVVWMDRNEVLVGDDFVQGLTRQLNRQDGLVFLLTEASSCSSWCHAEIQHALARGLPTFVVQLDAQSRLPDALERLLRDIQRVPWDVVHAGLGEQIHRARWRRWRRLFSWTAAVLVVSGATAGVAFLAVGRVNTLDMRRRVEATVADLGNATIVLSGDEVRSHVQPLRAMPELGASLRAVSDDPTRAPTARINAWQALDAMQQGRQTEWRTYVPQIEWKGGRLADTFWANTTYGSGKISDLQAHRVRMAGLVLGAGPIADKVGLSLVGVRIRDADIWFLRADATQMIDVEFLNSKFRGAQLDLSGAAGLRFLSHSADSNIITPEVSIIEDSWIVQRRAPPGAGVMDLSKPGQEILFDGVQFVRVRFEGHFKSEWFRNSHFTDCVFATALTANDLRRDGNSEEGSVFVGR